jgi:SAM-dependent methyltransferase
MKKITRKAQLKFLKPYRTSEVVLDIGAGKNPPYQRLFPKRLRLDVDPHMEPDILGDIMNLPFKNESQNTVLCLEVFEHLKEPERAVRELHRIMKKDGILILTTRFIYPLHNVPGDYWRYTPYILREIFKDWTVEKLEFESGSFTAIGILLQRLGLQSEFRGGKFSKAFIYLAAWIFTKLDWLVKKQYGEIERTHETDGVFSTGIYMVLRK